MRYKLEKKHNIWYNLTDIRLQIAQNGRNVWLKHLTRQKI